MIDIQDLSRHYGKTVALANVSVHIERGEIVGLLGHNGAGKTTLMKVLTGYLEPTAGTVVVDGADVVAQRQEVQRKIGYLPENAPMYPEMLVQDYLLMMAGLRGIEPDRREQVVAAAVRATGLEKKVVEPIATLSRGFQQRVGLAQAILHRPSVLVLDEPTNGLDPIQIEAIRELILELGKDATVLLSTHILQEVEAVCERVLVLIDGHLVADAPLRELLASNVVRLSVADGTEGVEKTLRTMDGVRKVRHVGPDDLLPGHQVWNVEVVPETTNAPDIVVAAQAAGWRIGAVAPETRSLQNVFRSLEQKEAARKRAEGQA